MESHSQSELRYQPVRCSFFDKTVQGILVRQTDGGWRIVNCADKTRACFDVECAFTLDGGRWPFPGAPTDPVTPA